MHSTYKQFLEFLKTKLSETLSSYIKTVKVLAFVWTILRLCCCSQRCFLQGWGEKNAVFWASLSWLSQKVLRKHFLYAFSLVCLQGLGAERGAKNLLCGRVSSWYFHYFDVQKLGCKIQLENTVMLWSSELFLITVRIKKNTFFGKAGALQILQFFLMQLSSSYSWKCLCLHWNWMENRWS